MRYDFDFWLKWSSTFILVVTAVAIITDTMDFLPENKILGFLGAFGWMCAAYRMKETSLWIVNLIISLIYIIGWITLWIN